MVFPSSECNIWVVLAVREVVEIKRKTLVITTLLHTLCLIVFLGRKGPFYSLYVKDKIIFV